MLKIKDSATQKFINIDQDKVSIYNCGPTVYNDVHIGNVRPLITFDVLYRYLKYTRRDVVYVHNITDIDDKIINRSIELKRSEAEISEHYYQEYLKIVDQLNVLRMDVLPKVSDNILGIINYIEQLVNSKHAYVIDGDVYFDIKSIKNYGCVSHQKIDKLLDGVRKENNENKKYPLDFALWKQTEVGLAWKSPWNEYGRPGWHTECVYLINKYIGKQTVIHGGGVDLKFPHHENENVQNVALNNIGLAKCWMHVGHVNIDGKKMSKSLNNFILAKDILAKYDANTIRWFFFQTQYASPLNFSYDGLEVSKNEVLKIFKAMNNALITLYSNNIKFKFERISLPEPFTIAVNNDLDFPNMITVIWSFVKDLPNLIKTKNLGDLLENVNKLINMFIILGLEYKNPLESNDSRELINNWIKALNNKDYQQADLLRSELTKKNII